MGSDAAPAEDVEAKPPNKTNDATPPIDQVGVIATANVEASGKGVLESLQNRTVDKSTTAFSIFEGIRSGLLDTADGKQRSVNIGDGARIRLDSKDRLGNVIDSSGNEISIEYEGDTTNVKSMKYPDGSVLKKTEDGRWQRFGKDGNPQGASFRGEVKVEDRLKGILSIDNRDTGIREFTDPRGGITVREQYKGSDVCTIDSPPGQGRVLDSTLEFKNGVLQKVTDGPTGRVIQGTDVKTYDPAKPETDPKIPGVKINEGDSFYKMPARAGSPESTVVVRKDGAKVVVQNGIATEYNAFNQEIRKVDSSGNQIARTDYDASGNIVAFSQKGVGEFKRTGTETVGGVQVGKWELQGKTPPEYLIGNMIQNSDGSRVFDSPTSKVTLTTDGIKTVVDKETGNIQVLNGKDVVASQTKSPDGKLTISVGDKYQFVQGDKTFTDQKSGKVYGDVSIDPKTGKIILTDATTQAKVAIDVKGGTEQSIGSDRDVRIVRSSEPSGEILQTTDAFNRQTTYSYEGSGDARFLSTIKTPTETWQLQKDSIDPKTGIGLWSNGIDKPQRMKMTVDDKGTLRMEYVDDARGKVREQNTAGQERVVYSDLQSGSELLNNQIDVLVRPDGSKMPVYRNADGIVAVENSQGELLVSKGSVTPEMKDKYGDKITEVLANSIRINDSGDITYKEASGGDRSIGNWVTEKMSSVKDPATGKFMMTRITWEGDPSQGKWSSIYMPQVDEKGNVSKVGIVRENTNGLDVYSYIQPNGDRTALSRVNYDSNLNRLTVQKDRMGQTEVFDQNGRKISIRGDNGRIDIKYNGDQLTPSEVTTTQGTYVRVQAEDGSSSWQRKANPALKQEAGALQKNVELPEGFILNDKGQVVSKEVGAEVTTTGQCTVNGDVTEKTYKYPDGRTEVIKYVDKPVVDDNGERVTERTVTREDGTNVVTRFNDKGERLQTLYKNDKGQVTVAEGQGVTTWFTYDDKGQVKAIVSTDSRLNREMQPDGTWKGPNGTEKWNSVTVDKNTGWTVYSSADLTRTVFTYGFVKDTKPDGSSVIDLPGGTGAQYNVNAYRPIEVDTTDPKNVVVKAGDLKIGTFDGANVEQLNGNTYVYKTEGGVRVLDKVITGDKIITYKDGKPDSLQQVVAKTEPGGPRYELKTLSGTNFKSDVLGNTVVLDDKGNKLVVYSGDKTITFKTEIDSNFKEVNRVDVVTDASTGNTYRQTPEGVEITGADGKKQLVKNAHLKYENASLQLTDGVNTIALNGTRQIYEDSSGITVYNTDGSIVKVNSATGHVEIVKYDIQDGKIVQKPPETFRGSYRVTSNGDFLLYNTDSGSMTTFKATGEPSVEVSREITANFRDGSFTIDKQGNLVYTNSVTKASLNIGKAVVNTETGTPIITAQYSEQAYSFLKDTGVATRQILLGAPGTNAPYIVEQNGKLYHVDKMGVKTEFTGSVKWDTQPPTVVVDNPKGDPKLVALQASINSAGDRSAQIVFAQTQDIKESRFKPVLDAQGKVVKYEQVADMPTTLTLRSGEKVDLTKVGFGVASTSTERNTTVPKVPVVPAANLATDTNGLINPNAVVRDIIGANLPKIETPKGVFGPSIAATVDQTGELKKNDLTLRFTQVLDGVSLDIRKAFVNSNGVIPDKASPAERAALQTIIDRSNDMGISAPAIVARGAEMRFNLAVGDTKAYLDPKFNPALVNDPSLALNFNPKIAGVATTGFTPAVIKDGVVTPAPGTVEALRVATAERIKSDLKLPGDVYTTAQRNQFEFDKATLSAALTVAREPAERAAILSAIQNLTAAKNATGEILRDTNINFGNFLGATKGVITPANQPEANALVQKIQAAKLVSDMVLQTATSVATGIKQATVAAEKIEELRTQLARIKTSEGTALTKAEIEKQIQQERQKLVESLNAALKPLGLEVVHSPDTPNGTSGAMGRYIIETRPLDTSGLPPNLRSLPPSQIDISAIQDPGQRAIAAALQVREMTSAAMKQYVETVLTIGALNRSAMDFLPNFMLTGDLNPIKSASSTPFTQSISSMPVDLNTRVSALTGRGMNTIITADGTIISIDRALANPSLLAQLLATNQISINTLNGLLASADLVRILNIAVSSGLTYTQLTNSSNPELAKYFGTTADGVKMGFNVQVGYASGLVYTSQNGVLVPARLNPLEDGIFIQSLQGQKTITEVIQSSSGFVTISNGKNRGVDDDDEDEEEDEEGSVATGSKEDFGGKIPTAQPVTQTQTTASQDPTAVLASNQPVPLPDFLILPDGSMEPMPAEWKTKANHEHGHVDVIDENGKHVHVIDAKGNVLTEQQIEKAKQDVIAAKAAEAKAASTSTDFSPTAPEASLNVPLAISDFVANFGIENQGQDQNLGQGAYIDNDVSQASDASDPLSYINGLPIDSNTGFPYDPNTGYILNPNTGDIIGNINDQTSSMSTIANPFDGRLVDPVTGFPYDPSTGILYDPLSGNPVGSVTPEADPIIDLSNDIAMIQDNVETRLDDISAYSHVQDALNDAQDVEDIHHEVASDLATRPEGMDFGTDEEYKEKEKERLDNILNQLEEEEKRLEEQEDELRKRRDEIERLTKLMNSLLATRRQAELDRIRRLIEQQRKIEEFIAKDIRRIKYTVRKGDTLEGIAKKHFRDPRLARLIYEMNPAKIKLSQEEGKTAYQLTLNSVLTLPSPRQAREWISRGKYLTAVDNSYVAQTELTADDLANMEKRRLNVESVLGALGMAADTNYKPTYTVRFGDSLRSIAMKHPALNDVSLWRLLAKVNDLSIETDAMGTPKATLERGVNLNLPSKEEIAQFRKDNGALVHPSSLKQGANGPADLVTNVTVFKECPSCKENTPSGVSLCHCCGFVFQETANGVGPETKISTVSKQVTLTNIGGASTEHDPLAPKQDKEDNVHTLNLPEIERKVANSDVSPLPKTEVDPKGVPNVSPAAKADITLKLNDPISPRVDTGITNTGANSDAFLNSMSSMQKSRKDSFSIPSHKYNMSKLVENLSDTSRIVLLDSELDSNNQKAERWQLEVLKDEEWTPVVAYEIIGDNSIRHEYNVTGKARKSIKMNLPSAAVEEMVRNDLSRNWQDYCQKFLTGKKLSQ